MTEARRKAKIRLLEKHITLSDLAAMAGLAKATIHNVLNGGSSSRKSKQAITNALGKQVWDDVAVTAKPYTMPVGMEFVFNTSTEADEKAAEFAGTFGAGRAKVVGNCVRLLKRTPAIVLLRDHAVERSGRGPQVSPSHAATKASSR